MSETEYVVLSPGNYGKDGMIIDLEAERSEIKAQDYEKQFREHAQKIWDISLSTMFGLVFQEIYIRRTKGPMWGAAVIEEQTDSLVFLVLDEKENPKEIEAEVEYLCERTFPASMSIKYMDRFEIFTVRKVSQNNLKIENKIEEDHDSINTEDIPQQESAEADIIEKDDHNATATFFQLNKENGLEKIVIDIKRENNKLVLAISDIEIAKLALSIMGGDWRLSEKESKLMKLYLDPESPLSKEEMKAVIKIIKTIPEEIKSKRENLRIAKIKKEQLEKSRLSQSKKGRPKGSKKKNAK